MPAGDQHAPGGGLAAPLTYTEALDYITGLGRFGIKLGTERTAALLEAAGNPQAGIPGALIAGTNGKGSTAAALAAILQQAGHRVGTMPSPHLSSYTERIQVDGRPVAEEEFAAAVERLRPAVDAVAAQLGPPTEFELLTAVAIRHLADRGCDRLVIEVGMGGRLDATNALDLGVAVITNVALDHTQYLGDTIERIATEKAGIIKPGNTVVTGAEGPALDVVAARGAELGAEVWKPALEGVQGMGWRGSRFDVHGPGFAFNGLSTPLAGVHQPANAALAAAAAVALDVRDGTTVARGLAATRIPGRLERLPGRPAVVLDGGHNPAALARLADSLPALVMRRRVVVVFGMMADKDIDASLAELQRFQADAVVFTAAASGRAEPAAALAVRWGQRSALPLEPAMAALERARALAGPEGVVLVCGSLYLVGEVRALLVAEPG